MQWRCLLWLLGSMRLLVEPTDADQSNQNQQVEVLVSASRIKKTVIGLKNRSNAVEVVDLSPKIKETVIGTQAS
ncbi:hypothetical protein Ddc_19296 [Ditylenchus destructor]|nr:hypothetical protein Ddc_19296 [Ditylenchus destructor]